MSQLTFRIDPQILQRFPDIKVAALVATVDNQSGLNGLVAKLSEQLPTVVERINAVEPITKLDEIAVWRQTYGAMSIKPSKFHSSIEALLRRVKKGDDISTGLPVVDLYNLISVIHGTPMGAYDRGKLPGSGDYEMILRLGKPEADQFEPLGGRADSYPLNSDLVVHAMGTEILCWGFNTRDSANSCVDDTSRSIIFMSESSSPVTAEKPTTALNDLAALLADIGVSVGAVDVADAGNPEIDI
ncbi:MAG: phenylalanine--tRNA ligase beta subunit-related protein [Rhizobiaceae bacterium]